MIFTGSGGGAVQGPAEPAEDADRQQPPGVDPGRVHQQRRQRQGGDHHGRDAPVIADHEVVPERSDRLEPLHQLVTPSEASDGYATGGTGVVRHRRSMRV
jgi:hypothetical protein